MPSPECGTVDKGDVKGKSPKQTLKSQAKAKSCPELAIPEIDTPNSSIPVYFNLERLFDRRK
jgi:hypothetical protein